MAVIVKGITSSGGGTKIASMLNDDGTQSLIISDKDSVTDLNLMDAEIDEQTDLIDLIKVELNNIGSGGGAGGSGGNELLVTGPSGFTVTASKGDVTKTSTESDGVYTFVGLEAGVWTVTLTNGEEYVSKEVEVITETLEIAFGSLPTYTYTGESELKKASDYGLSGDYDVLALLSSGTLTFDSEAEVDIFVVGGGGSGGADQSWASGGGGGGYTTTVKEVTVVSPLTCTVGAGAAGRKGTGQTGGTTSVVDGSITVCSADGGLGGSSSSGTGTSGGKGGSGGGSINGQTSNVSGNGGSDGSNGYYAKYSNSAYSLEVSTVAIGQGTTTRAFGESGAALFGGGGGASACYNSATYETSLTFGQGGEGGGGIGGIASTGSGIINRAAGDGVANTGGGGGAAGPWYATSEAGGDGGSGIILIRKSNVA